MGVNQSVQAVDEGDGDEEEEEEEEEEEDEDEGDDEDTADAERRRLIENHPVKKVLEQEPEMLPLHASASPLSPQLSSLGTPRLGPSIKVWDPYNVLAPPPPPPPVVFSRSYSSSGMEDESVAMEVYLINHGECELNLRPDLVAGRCPDAGLTHVGKRQARALAVFLNSQGVRFNAVYSSPLERARATATSVCQQMNFAEEQIQSSDAIVDMSHGHWEGCPRSEVFTPEILSLIDRLRPDFSAPSGESIRQVNFRMVQFINETVLCLLEKLRSDFSSPHPVENHVYQNHSSLHEQDGPSHAPPHWDLLHRHRQMSRKKSGKSRLQFMTGTRNHDSADEFSPRDSNHQSPIHDTAATSSSGIPSIGIFTHAMPIKCLLTGILECSPVMTNKICIDDSSITVIQHSWKTGWQIKRLNDIAHLRLL